MRERTLGMALAVAVLVVAGCGGGNLYEGMPGHVKRRHVVLEGARNFRDLGGYATEDGRSVRWGTFYRSDSLAELTDGDLEKLSALGVRLVCDFRSEEERREAPDRLPADPAPDVAELPIGVEGSQATELQERLTSGDIAGLDLSQMLVDGNRSFITDFVHQYRAMFQRLLREEALPVLVHCTGGKDRAGMASALILRSLGVPDETVFEDYLLTNHYTAERVERTLMFIRLTSFFRTDPELVRPVMIAKREYLEAGFEEIGKQWGSFDAFRRGALGVSDAQLVAFRDRALE